MFFEQIHFIHIFAENPQPLFCGQAVYMVDENLPEKFPEDLTSMMAIVVAL